MTNVTAGEVAYQAYRTAIGAKDRRGNAIPVWAETAHDIREVWEQVAAAVEAIGSADELRGRWYCAARNGKSYLVPCDKLREWIQYVEDAEAEEPSSIVPRFAIAVPSSVVILRVLR